MTIILTTIGLTLFGGLILMAVEAYKAITLQCPKCGSWYVDDKHDEFFKCEACGEQWP